ncbi:MAG: ThiF family adenylyltransferase [Fimbriimonadales bacterium]
MESLSTRSGAYEQGEVRLPLRVWAQLQNALQSEPMRATRCFLLCQTLEIETRVILLAQELVSLQEDDYAERAAHRIVVRPERVQALLSRCAQQGLALLEADGYPQTHQEHGSNTSPENTVDQSALNTLSTNPIRFGKIKFHTDRRFEGYLWDELTQQAMPITRLKVMGIPYTIYYSGAGDSHDFADAQLAVYDRQVRAFGVEGQIILNQLRVALVGAGGLGSQVALALTHLGIGELVLIDPDRLELSNLNRVVGALHAQATMRLFKVDALARHLNRVRMPLEVPVTPLAVDARTEIALRALLSADLIVGAVDSAVVRQYLNLVAVCGLIPYLDAGVGVRAENGKLQQGGGQVQVVMPGQTACLTCVGHLVNQSVLEQLTPDQRAMSVARGYVQGEAIPNPQVVFLNGVVANLLVWELVKLCTGCHPVQPYVYYDLLRQQVSPVSADRHSDCFVCGDSGSLLATGCKGIAEFKVTAPRVSAKLPAPSSKKRASIKMPKRSRKRKN